MTKLLEKSGKCKTGASVSNCFTRANAWSCSGPQRLLTSLIASFFVRATKGAIVAAKLGINFLTKFTMPNTDLNCLIFVGFGKSMIALMRSSPIRIPSDDSIWPKYLTSLGPN